MVVVNSLLTEILKLSKEELKRIEFEVSVALIELDMEAEDG
jgi:hypothetical protein